MTSKRGPWGLATGNATLDLLLRAAETFADRVQAIEPQPGSSLAGDDEATPVDRISWQVHAALSVSLDHLGQLRDAIEATGSLRAMGPYPLIRSAIESAGLGLWILEAGTRNTRVLRSLRLVWDQVEKTGDLTAKLGTDSSDVLVELQARILLAQSQRPSIRGKAINKLSTMTEILGVVGRRFDDRSMLLPLQAWSVCASLSHANKASVAALLDRETLRPLDESASESNLTSNPATAALLVDTAVTMMVDLLELVEEMSAAPS